MTEMTEAQRDRQHSRGRDGKYQEYNHCERCGKSAGYDYFSAPWCNASGEDVCLCEKCSDKLNANLDKCVCCGEEYYVPDGKCKWCGSDSPDEATVS